ncbi:unnamed protein product [Pedinophyceae sp. YPF-701]|nr:unnamed protein product [Pedinophyceae sp. YPF-701]
MSGASGPGTLMQTMSTPTRIELLSAYTGAASATAAESASAAGAGSRWPGLFSRLGTAAEAAPAAAAAGAPKAKRKVPWGLVLLGTYYLYQYYRYRRSLTLPSTYILDVDLESNAVTEQRKPPNPVKAFLGLPEQTYSLVDLVEAIEAAGEDPRCAALSVVTGASAGNARASMVEEIRDAVGKFRRHGELRGARTFAYADSFGEGGSNGTLGYYLASACERVFLQPHGSAGVAGFVAQQPFLRPLLDKWGVQPLFFTRREYKNMANMFTERTFTKPHKEALGAVLGSTYAHVVQGIAASRGLKPQAVLRAVDAAPLSADDAVRRGLVDAQAYRDQYRDYIGDVVAVSAAMKKAVGAAGGPAKLLEALPPEPAAAPAPAKTWWDALAIWRPAERPAAEPAAEDKAEKTDVRPTQPADAAARHGRVPRVSMHKFLRVRQHEREKVRRQQQKRWWLDTTDERLRELMEQRVRVATEAGVPMGTLSLAPTVAVVCATGNIMAGPPPPKNPLGEESAAIYSGGICRLLRDIREDPNVRVVLLRVDSPGGSALASESIHREVVALKDAGKKIIVSMGSVAASGGYYIAAPADTIFALPTTITGSIGVVFGKFNVDKFLRDQGVHVETLGGFGRNAAALSAVSGFTRAQVAQVEKQLDETYARFLHVVADGRKMTEPRARRIAKGRIWSGAQAEKLGLVDRLGGMTAALLEAKRECAALAGVDPAVVQIVDYPRKPLGFFESVLSFNADPRPAYEVLAEAAGARLDGLCATAGDAVAWGRAAVERGAGMPVGRAVEGGVWMEGEGGKGGNAVAPAMVALLLGTGGARAGGVGLSEGDARMLAQVAGGGQLLYAFDNAALRGAGL